jgi:hypothetical protein
MRDLSEDDQAAGDQPRKRAAVGDGISAGSASPYRERDSSSSPPPRRSKARQNRLQEHLELQIKRNKICLNHKHDSFLAIQHPSANPTLRHLASKYAMPARM